ncbi:YlbF family regulator [Salinarchaeum laminariae]|uniref:YlbF family regulator n=1 Tax=Salinarchaeum laminariae TaxID=869888 RepID=UPI0020C00816|nr:YlbF family regulator [Salinarchaeum laminariae]
MSIDADIEADAGVSETVERLGQELGEAITSLPEYERYESAKTAVENHEDAQERIAEVEQLREEFMLARQIGEADQADLQALQSAQAELHDLPVMEEYLEAEAALNGRLEAINDAISEPLDVDFGQTAGGCCED